MASAGRVGFSLALPVWVSVALSAAAARGADETASKDHVFPLLADGGGYRFELFLTNFAAGGNSCEFEWGGARGFDEWSSSEVRFDDRLVPRDSVSLTADDTLIFLGEGRDSVSLRSVGAFEKRAAFGFGRL